MEIQHLSSHQKRERFAIIKLKSHSLKAHIMATSTQTSSTREIENWPQDYRKNRQQQTGILPYSPKRTTKDFFY